MATFLKLIKAPLWVIHGTNPLCEIDDKKVVLKR